MKMVLLLVVLIGMLYGQTAHNIQLGWQKTLKELRDQNNFDPSNSNHKVFAQAPKDVLKKLIYDDNPIVRVYAFTSYHQKYPQEDVFNILWESLSDKTEVLVGSPRFCVLERSSVCFLFFEEMEKHLTSLQRDRIIQYLFTNENNLYIRRHVLKTWKLEKYYDLVRILAENGEATALIALAKFRYKRDGKLIINKLNSSPMEALQAIRIFPHKIFLPHLQQLSQQILTKDVSIPLRWFCATVAEYKNKEALEILTSILNGDREAGEAIFSAISQHKIPLYTSLLLRLWSEQGIVTPKIANYLLEKNPKQSLKIINKGPLQIDYMFDLEHTDKNITPFIMELWWKNRDKNENFIKQLNESLLAADEAHFDAIIKYAVMVRAESSIPVFFKRYVTDTNPYIFLPVARAILAYNREKLIKELQQAVTQHKHLQHGWGGEELKKLLQQHIEKKKK